MRGNSSASTIDSTSDGTAIVLGILSQATRSQVTLDDSLREQGFSSFHAVLVAAALEEHGCDDLDYIKLLGSTPRQLAELIPAT